MSYIPIYISHFNSISIKIENQLFHVFIKRKIFVLFISTKYNYSNKIIK